MADLHALAHVSEGVEAEGAFKVWSTNQIYIHAIIETIIIWSRSVS